MSQTCGCACGHGSTETTAGVAGGVLALEDTVDTVAKRSPSALAALRELGIDTCCGGGLTLAQAAASRGIAPERVLRALRERAEMS